MKRSGIKPLTYEQALEKQKQADERKRRKARLPKLQGEKPAVKTKKARVKTLKRKLWAIFSQYIRKSYADKNGMVMTCDGKRIHWTETHCGHLYTNSERNQSLGGNELWYYEHNFAPQSSNGNYFNADDSAKNYMLWAVNLYGVDEVNKMRVMKNTFRLFTEEELLAKYEHYVAEFAKL